ncbi:choice-of-anchor tandem repeat GloVer-containing protein, partial [Escherichia coli]
QVTFTVLASFDGKDAGNPYAGLIQSTDGNFYGTTGYGGANNEGTVFKITPGGKVTVLHSFNGRDGFLP